MNIQADRRTLTRHPCLLPPAARPTGTPTAPRRRDPRPRPSEAPDATLGNGKPGVITSAASTDPSTPNDHLADDAERNRRAIPYGLGVAGVLVHRGARPASVRPLSSGR